jgi:hypothetical protein
VPRAARVLRLLDLRGEGARRAGLPELATRTADRDLSCAWSRHIYEDEATYGALDGLIWASGRTGGACLALYERARGALECPISAACHSPTPASWTRSCGSRSGTATSSGSRPPANHGRLAPGPCCRPARARKPNHGNRQPNGEKAHEATGE